MQALEALGYTAAYETDNTTFRFGNQSVLKSKELWRLPVQICGVPCTLRISQVPGHCPLLISECTMEELDVTIAFWASDTCSWSLGCDGLPFGYLPGDQAPSN